MARPGRAYWKGFLRLSLVTIAVEVYNAVDTAADISFNQIHKPTGKRINYTKTVQGIGPVDSKDIVKGYAIDKDTYVTLEPEELEAIKLETKKTLDLTEFVDRKDIDPRFFERPYYIVPADEYAAEGYLVIREALRDMDKLGVGQVTMAGREYLVAVGPIGKGLGMEMLRYANEVRSAETYFNDLPNIKIDQEMVALATELINRKSAEFEPAKYRNHYSDALHELVKEKAKGKKIVTAEEPEPARGTVINLMDALRKSVQSGGKAAATQEKAPPAKTPAKAAPAAKRKAGTRR
jgi:DNA end-binding protein Ku